MWGWSWRGEFQCMHCLLVSILPQILSYVSLLYIDWDNSNNCYDHHIKFRSIIGSNDTESVVYFQTFLSFYKVSYSNNKIVIE